MNVEKKTDVLIVGAGIAGLTCAIKLAMARPDISITVMAKANKDESNTKYAQGGVAAVWNIKEDTLQKHIEDTLDAGDGLCKEDIVRMIVEEGPVRVRELID